MAHPDPTEAADGDLLERGRTIDRFVVLGIVGRGGMGEVYAAYDPELDRKVAIKLLRAREGAEDGKGRLLREAQAIAKLQHPNVVVVFDVGTHGDSVFVAMEFVDGLTVSAWLKAAQRSRREILEVYTAAGRGLAAAHAAGLVHRDFKPDNVMVSRDGQVRVMDFGLAAPIQTPAPGDPSTATTATAPAHDRDGAPPPRETASQSPGSAESAPTASQSGGYLSEKLTRTGALMGTPAYMSPEQFAGAPADARTDQFSFCVALYEALLGSRPFEGETFLALMTNVTTGAVVTPAKSSVPARLRKVLLRGLSTKADARYPSMRALLAALQSDPTARTRRLALGALLVAAIAGGFVVARRPVERPPVCGGGAERLAGAWTLEPRSPRRASIERAFAATREVFAGQAFATAARYLDDYARGWLDAYRDACEATQVRGEQSADVLDLRMACLNDRLVELRALTDIFMTANGKVVENAVSGVSSLGPIAHCSDVRLLRTGVKPPRDEPTSRRVEELQASKAKLFASMVAARCDITRRFEQELLAGARAVGYPPVLAEGLLASGKVEDACGARAETLTHLFGESFTVALGSGHELVAAESAAMLASILADRERQLESARQWLAVGEALVTHIGGSPPIEVALDQATGLVARLAREEDASFAALERARTGTIKLRGADHPYVGLILNAEGLTLHEAGEEERALQVLRGAEEIFWKAVGPDHPWVAMVLANEGDTLNALHRHVEARAAFEMTLAIWRRQKAEPARMASSQTGLGLALLGEGRPLDAIEPLAHALEARADRSTPPELVGQTRFALARAEWARSGTRTHALALARAARADYASVASGDASVAQIDAWLRSPSAKL